MIVQMLSQWLSRKSYIKGATLVFDRNVDKEPARFGPGGAEFAKARFRELMEQGGESFRSTQQAILETQERFPPQQ